MRKVIYTTCSDTVLRGAIENTGVTVAYYENNDLLYEAFRRKNCDIVMLDRDAPGSDGFVISAKIRQISNLPIIMLSSHESDEDYAFGITIGADVYLTKPVSMVKLIAHIRREQTEPTTLPQEPDDTLTFADITFHLNRWTASCNSKSLRFTPKEYALLKTMVEKQDTAISRKELVGYLWGDNASIGLRATDDIVKRIRKKLVLANSRVLIDTVRGFGFRLGIQDDSEMLNQSLA